MNPRMRNRLICALAAATSCEAGARGADDIVAVSGLGNVYHIDSSTGRGELINGNHYFTSVNCLTKNDAGVMHAASVDSLITIDEFNGNASLLATIGIDYVRGLAFAPDGTLYAIDDGGIAIPDVLYRIDPVTGATTLVAPTSHARIQGFAIDRSGSAFAWDTEAGLLTVDLATGATTDVNGQMDGTRDIGALTFSAGGELFGCGYYFFSLDRTSGARSLIGSGGYVDIRGMAFIGSASGYALLISGGCPGELTVEWKGAEPGGLQALVVGARRGSSIIPPGQPCAGATLGVAGQVQLVSPPGAFGTGTGSGRVARIIGTSACGRFLQLVEGDSCATSNVAQIP